mmetsp:Transcript_2783/g.3846  ORF Transcript_2783/g.3846 Transcript_2783/m.3846 type:complete len:213 (+) Transcript_2783:1666-2304(+)
MVVWGNVDGYGGGLRCFIMMGLALSRISSLHGILECEDKLHAFLRVRLALSELTRRNALCSLLGDLGFDLLERFVRLSQTTNLKKCRPQSVSDLQVVRRYLEDFLAVFHGQEDTTLHHVAGSTVTNALHPTVPVIGSESNSSREAVHGFEIALLCAKRIQRSGFVHHFFSLGQGFLFECCFDSSSFLSCPHRGTTPRLTTGSLLAAFATFFI